MLEKTVVSSSIKKVRKFILFFLSIFILVFAANIMAPMYALLTKKSEMDINRPYVQLPLDSDGDGIPDDIDSDDDNDGIPDYMEDRCETTIGFGTPPPTVSSTNYVSSIYSDYNNFWASSSSSKNPISFDKQSNLLAFYVKGKTYATGGTAIAMKDNDSNGRFDSMDTNNDGTGDISLEETLWTALKPVTKINSGVRLEGRAIDGDLTKAVGPLLTSGGLAFNPYLYQGERGLDMAYGIANIGNTWYFRLGGVNSSAYDDGIMDILLTQGAQLGSGDYNKLHLLDIDGNYLGNGVQITWLSVPIVGYSNIDQYNPNDSANSANQKKDLRFAAVELSEFGLTPAERSEAVIFRLEISANADPLFFAVNEDSFITSCVGLDSDGDGIVNSLDIDSDNDGIYDAIEAGHGKNSIAGRVTGPVGTDGIPDSVQAPSQVNNGTINYNVADSNNDNEPDYSSLDSDGDGCVDTLEAGFTDGDNDGLLGNSPVSIDINGAVTGQGGYTSPWDKNFNGIFDYRETSGSPLVLIQPLTTILFDGYSGSITMDSKNTTNFQWQVSSDGGSTFTDILDGALYSGAKTKTLNINKVRFSLDNLKYRVLLSNDVYVCDPNKFSNVAVVYVRVKTVITNRKQTYRVNKDSP